MSPSEIPARRLVSQALTRPLATPTAVIEHLLAVQAQDYAGCKWAVALRVKRALRDADLERCFDAGSIVRTHALRGTWQLVLPKDVPWLLELGRDRVLRRAERRFRELGLDRATLKKSATVLARAVGEGRHLTRAELQARLTAARVGTTEERLSHVLLHAELHGHLVSGARRGKHTTHCAFEERIPAPSVRFAKERALVEFARRYFTSRGPATLADFVWWSGLEPREAREGLEGARSELEELTLGGEKLYVSARTTRTARSTRTARGSERAAHALLPAFDEYLVAYRGRDAVLDPLHVKRVNAGGGMLSPAILGQGRVLGAWRRELGKTNVSIELDWFAPPGQRALAGVREAARRFAAFLGLEPELAEKSARQSRARPA